MVLVGSKWSWTISFIFYFSDIGKGKLTVGKIYGGLLILENWKASKFGNMPNHKVSYQVENLETH